MKNLLIFALIAISVAVLGAGEAVAGGRGRASIKVENSADSKGDIVVWLIPTDKVDVACSLKPAVFKRRFGSGMTLGIGNQDSMTVKNGDWSFIAIDAAEFHGSVQPKTIQEYKSIGEKLGITTSIGGPAFTFGGTNPGGGKRIWIYVSAVL
jgi:hypothetical protein